MHGHSGIRAGRRRTLTGDSIYSRPGSRRSRRNNSNITTIYRGGGVPSVYTGGGANTIAEGRSKLDEAAQ